MLTKLYTFSISFPERFRTSFHQGAGWRMDVHRGPPYNQRINHLGVIKRVALDRGTAANALQADLPLEAVLLDYSLNLRGLAAGLRQ